MAFCKCGRLSWDRLEGVKCSKCLLDEVYKDLNLARDRCESYHHQLDMYRGPNGRLPIMFNGAPTELRIEYLNKKIEFFVKRIIELKKDSYRPAPELCGPYDPYIRF
jgi:hypothetical protein